jgi:hypothetical protein
VLKYVGSEGSCCCMKSCNHCTDPGEISTANCFRDGICSYSLTVLELAQVMWAVICQMSFVCECIGDDDELVQQALISGDDVECDDDKGISRCPMYGKVIITVVGCRCI